MYYGNCENGEYGAYAKAFLSNLHQPEVGILNSLVVLSPNLLGNHLYYCHHFKQYKFGSVKAYKNGIGLPSG